MTPIRTVFAACAALLLAACATGGGSSKPSAQTALERETYIRDWKQKPVIYTTVAPVDEICDEDACTVTIEVEYDVRIPLAGVGVQHVAAVLEERWLRLDGAWYYLPDDFR